MKEVHIFVGNVTFKRDQRKSILSHKSKKKVHRRSLRQVLKRKHEGGDKDKAPNTLVPVSGIAHKSSKKIKTTDSKRQLESSNKVDSLQDLNDIFSSLKPKQSSQVPEASTEGSRMLTSRDQSYGLVQSAGGTRSSIISPNPPVHRFDQSTGLPVYKYTALLVGDGGGTPLCPFDCECCF
mmetsp:Transcript_29405/g.54442  ORF Transcript_29405/g.54442 Transcript_29405/m.54442 type:complete len:180 (-) Transcript_29405:281-820(-)